jgi:hypothetical protein
VAELHVASLYQGRVTSPTFVTVYTVPTGRRVVLRMVNVRNHANAAANAYLDVDGSLDVMFRVLTASGTTGCESQWNGWIVLNAAQTIKAASSQSGGVDFIVSGSSYTV